MTGRRAFLLAAVTTTAAIVTGCGDDGPQVTAGEVIDREYDDADQTMTCVPTGMPGKAGYNPCGSQIWQTDPARWRLKLSCDDTETWVDVDTGAYTETAVGDMWPPGSTDCEVTP